MMTRRSTQLLLALGSIALLAAPGSARAGAMLKEHECVGKDTALNLLANAEDAHCTPIGSEIFPPGGLGNTYDAGDVDENNALERFVPTGALEFLTSPGSPASNRWLTIPTIKEPGFRQVGFPATMTYTMLVKSSTVLSDLEVTCSVCAERPQNSGPGQTFVTGMEDPTPFEAIASNSAAFVQRLNIAQRPWEMAVSHNCGGANPLRGPGCGGRLMAKTTPGLRPVNNGDVTFLGCKPTVVRIENRGQFFRGDTVTVRIDVPPSARMSGTFDVTSCEASYIRSCLPGEGQFKDICRGEP